MRSQKKGTDFTYSHKLIEATMLLRYYGLLEEHEFPKIVSPVTMLTSQGIKVDADSYAFSWEVNIKIRESMNPNELVLCYNLFRNELSLKMVGEKTSFMNLTKKWQKRPFKSRR